MIVIIFIIAMFFVFLGVILLDLRTENDVTTTCICIALALLIWGIISCSHEYTKEKTKWLPVYIIENNAIIFDDEKPINVNSFKQFEKGDQMVKRTLGGEWLFGIYWEETSRYECCVGDPVEN